MLNVFIVSEGKTLIVVAVGMQYMTQLTIPGLLTVRCGR